MNTHTTAGGVLFNQTLDKIFLIYKKERNEWLLPKGHVEEGEALLDTAKREVYEETGYKSFIIIGNNPVSKNTFNFIDKDGSKAKKVVYFFAAMLLSNKRLDTKWQEEEGLDGKWFTLPEALESVEYDDIKLTIKDAYEQTRNIRYIA